jgi:signal transduction histidine kinase
MESNSNPLNRFPPALRLAFGVALVVLASLAGFYWLMDPPRAELQLMGLLLALTAGGSAIAGYGAKRLGWLERAPALHWSFLGGYIFSSLLTFLNVWITAKLMFVSEHDLLLATVLLGFATGLAVLIGYFLSSVMVSRIGSLRQVAETVSQGDFSARANAQGRDELARLSQTFNQMASQLQLARQRQTEMERSRRELIAWVSHDLQTPLASIRAMVEAIADGVVEDPDTRQRYLHTIQREIQGLSALIDDLFQLAQLDAGGLNLDRQMESLSDLISDTLEGFSELAAQRKVSLLGEVEPEIDPVWMDARHIGRVLDNMLKNALHHSPAGGQVRLQARRQGNQVEISVSDSGPGIPPGDLPFIFERFYRGEKSRNRQTGGAGLGLAIARGIVEAHGGQLRAENQPGQGAMFSIRLPSHPPGLEPVKGVKDG